MPWSRAGLLRCTLRWIIAYSVRHEVLQRVPPVAVSERCYARYFLLDNLHVLCIGGPPGGWRWNPSWGTSRTSHLTPAKKNMNVQFQTECAYLHWRFLTSWMFTLTVGFLQSLFSLCPCAATPRNIYGVRWHLILDFPWSLHYIFLLVRFLLIQWALSINLIFLRLGVHLSPRRVEIKTQTQSRTSQQGSRPDIIPQRAWLY